MYVYFLALHLISVIICLTKIATAHVMWFVVPVIQSRKWNWELWSLQLINTKSALNFTSDCKYMS